MYQKATDIFETNKNAEYKLNKLIEKREDHDDISISPEEFCTTSAVFGIDFEKAGNEALYSGISTKDEKIMALTVTTPRLIL